MITEILNITEIHTIQSSKKYTYLGVKDNNNNEIVLRLKTKELLNNIKYIRT